MRLTGVLETLGVVFATVASAQQYAGDVIQTSLRNVPGAEVAYFKIPGVMDSNKKKAANLTLINYYSHGKDGKRLVESKVQRAIIIIHGLNRDPDTYQSNMMSALDQVTGDPNINRDSVAIMSPYFANGDDKRTGYPWTDGLSPGRGSTTSALVWKSSQWSAGGNNQYPYYSQTTSSYTVLDTLVKYFDDKTLFPNMKQIVVAGHSLGGQTVQRYAAIGQPLNTNSPVTYWIGNPNSYVWLSTDRPLSTASCPTYDYYRDGYTNFTEYPMTYGQSLVSQGRSAILANYQSKQIAYARGTQDLGDDSSGCAPFTAGGDRNERFFNFIKAFPPSCNDPSGRNCDTVDLVNMGHDGGGMMAAAAGRARLFTDNFYGDGNRSYDFGYPRQQPGDDPFPDPSLNTTASSINNNTYAGNLTYAGCWFDSADFRSLDKQAYQSNTNTIELCTSTCVSQGFSIAGLEYGSQCYCGNVLNSRATKVVESSCGTPCSGNSSQTCGSGNRLSVFSNGTPKVLSPPTTPETIGNFYYSNCYTDTSPRTLSGKTISGSFMSLDYCANFCSGFKYFGTEYSSECYCGNYIESTAQIASSSDCSKTCANNTAQICGAGNRITLYENPDAAESSASTTATSSAPGSTSTSGTANGPTCPDSNGAIVTSNGLNFTIECGIDHQGGDLSNTYVSNFQQCIDACSSNSKCVDVSLSGSACYLKSTLGSAVTASYVWGAKLMVGGASSTVSSTTVSASGSSSSQSSSAVTSSSASSQVPSSATSATSSGATSTPSNIACPASNGNTYVGASGRSFTVECGIDHQGGDMGMKYVDTFQQCIDACDQTTGCVDVSLSGAACYMKSSVGAAANAPAILGAKLIESSSSSVATSTSTSASISTSASSTSVSVTSSQTSSGTSSSASATSTVTSCPSSDGSLVTLPSGNQYLIECGIDHQGGDLTSKSVASFADCIAACDSTPNCVDVSLSGDMCYMKNSVGPAINLSYIMGAKLMPASSSSSSSASSASTTSDSSSSTVSSQSSSSTSMTSSASDSSSSASSTSASLSGTSSSQSSATSATDSATVSLSTQSSSSATSDSSTISSSATPSSSSATSDSSAVSSSSTLSSSSASSDSATSSSSTQSSSSAASDSQSATTSASSTQSSSTDTSSSQSSSTQSSSSSVSASTTSDSSSSMSSTQSSSAQVSPTDSSSTQSSSSSASASATSDSAVSSSQSLTSSSQTSFSQSSSSAVSTSQSASSTSSSSVSVSATAPSGTSSSASASASAATLPTGFSYAGCFVDSSSARALPVSIGASSTQTQQQCAMSCQAKGYKYSGTEYANECWCGNSIPSNQAAESQCSMACKGDSTQKCGAGARLSVVSDDSWKQTFFARQSFDSWNLMGCYTDSTAKRSLPNSVSLSAFGGGANATVSNCLMACQKAGFTYCGEEYYAECYGSKSAPTTSLASGSDPLSAGCNYPCKGNSSESCGGSGRIIIYTTNLS